MLFHRLNKRVRHRRWVTLLLSTLEDSERSSRKGRVAPLGSCFLNIPPRRSKIRKARKMGFFCFPKKVQKKYRKMPYNSSLTGAAEGLSTAAPWCFNTAPSAGFRCFRSRFFLPKIQQNRGQNKGEEMGKIRGRLRHFCFKSSPFLIDFAF